MWGPPVKIIYRPVKMALTAEGRIFLEAHPDIYQREIAFMAVVKDLARKNQLEDRIDWDRVPKILKAREGIAQDITRDLPEQSPLPHPRPRPPGDAPFPFTGKRSQVRMSPCCNAPGRPAPQPGPDALSPRKKRPLT